MDGRTEVKQYNPPPPQWSGEKIKEIAVLPVNFINQRQIKN
jgi:hypothetical protein